MAIVRLAQFGAESRSAREYHSFDTSDPPADSTAARTGVYSYDIGNISSEEGCGFSFSQDILAARLAYAYNHRSTSVGLGSSNIYLFSFLDGNAIVFSAHIQYTSGLIYFTINGVEDDTLSKAQAGISTARRWLHLGATCKIGAPGFASFYVDGRQVYNYVGAITGAIDSVRFYKSGNAAYSSDSFIDDFYVDSIVGEVDAPPPTRRFYWIQPNAAGANTDWTPNTGANYQAVDDAPPDGDTTYVSAQTVGDKDTYNMASMAALPQDHNIYAVIAMAYLRKADAATPSEISLHTFDGTLYDEGASQGNLPTDYQFLFERFDAQPDASAWTEAAVNTIQMGITLTGE